MPVKYGQHFLIDQRIVNKIINSADLKENDVVLEIGPGRGVLTKHLLKVKKVYCVEIDKTLFDFLRRKFSGADNLVLINEDILKYEIPEDVNKIVANLPYQISSPVTEKILKFLNKQKRKGIENLLAILMYQREFAERLTAFPGIKDYSRISVLANYFAEVKLLFYVGKSSFRPPPKVDSAVIKFVPKDVEYDEFLFKLVKVLFMHKNKTVLNSLLDSRAYLSIKDKNELREIIREKLGDLCDEKVFYLEIEDLIEIANKLRNSIEIEVK